MSDTSTERELQSVVLLGSAPAGIGDALSPLIGDAGAQLPAGLPQLTVDVSGVPVTFTLIGEPLVASELDYAVRQSPIRELLSASVAQHQAYLVITTPVQPDVFGASARLSNVTAHLADDDNGVAVWLPEADFATTDVLYTGEVDRRPAVMWFNTMAANLDESTAIAHTIGLQSLGGVEVQVRASGATPGDVFQELRGAVATLLEGSVLPAPGVAVTIGGAPFVLTPAASIIGLGDVLEAVPAAQAPVPATTEAPKRKGWFGRG